MSGTIAARRSGMRAALARYRRESLGIRLFVWSRHILTPLERIAREVPTRGRVLDAGCGHGLFSNLIALQSPECEVLGVDPSTTKIEVARRSSVGLPNVRYAEGYVEEVNEAGFQAVCILDVLCLLPDAEKLSLLRHCRRLIGPDGVLLLKTNDTRPRWKYAITRLQERAMTGLKLTMGDGLYFRSAAQNAALLREAGFDCSVQEIDNWAPYPARLFIARPAASPGAEGGGRG